MRILLFLCLAILFSLSGFYFSRARRGWRAVARILRVATRPIAKIEEGPVEIEGTIRALERPIRGPSGKRCVYAEVQVAGFTHGGKNRERVHSETEERVAPAVVVDAAGDQVKIDLSEIELLGDHVMINGPRGKMRQSTKSWTKNVAVRAQHLEIIESSVQHDVRVVVSGRAKVVDSKVEMNEGGYRDGAPTEKKTFLIHGTPDEPLLVSEGTERQLLWQASWPVALLVVCATVALAFAGVVIAVLVA